MSRIDFSGLSKQYGRKTALDGIDLTIESGSLTVLCGPPLAGKSVLLRILVGLEEPSAGRILFDGRDITHVQAAERTIGYVPQSFALFPHMSVFDNIAYPMALQRVSTAEIERRVNQAAEILRIGKLLRKRPSELSGGEKQRAAIARGILKNAGIFVLDDPLVGLDFKLREALMEDLKDMRAELGATFLYATSDSLEALTMAEALVVIDRGRIVEAAPVATIYWEPSHLRAIELVGFPRCNILPGMLDGTQCRTDLIDFDATIERQHQGPVAVAIRAEHIEPLAGHASGTIRLMENLGAECVIYFEDRGHTLVTTAPSPATTTLDSGAPFPYRLIPSSLLLFDPATGQRIGRGAAHA